MAGPRAPPQRSLSDVSEQIYVVNGLWSQPRKAKQEEQKVPPRNGFTGGRRRRAEEDLEKGRPDMNLVMSQEAAAKDSIIEMLTSKLTKMGNALDSANAARHSLQQALEERTDQQLVERQVYITTEEDLRSQIETLQAQLSYQDREVERISDELKKAESQSPALIGQIQEETRRRDAVERALAVERSVVRRWVQRTGRTCMDTELTAALLAQEILELERELGDAREQLNTALHRVAELDEDLETEKKWREEAQTAQSSSEELLEASRIKCRALSLQLGKQTAGGAAVEAKLREVERNVQNAEREAEEKRDAALRRKRRSVTEKLADSKVKDDRIKALEKELAAQQERSAQQLAVIRQDAKEAAKHDKQRLLAITQRCQELEKKVSGSNSTSNIGAMQRNSRSAHGLLPSTTHLPDPSANNKDAPDWLKFDFAAHT